MKICTKCGVEKELTGFHKDVSKKDGHLPDCKECRVEANSRWYPKNKKMSYKITSKGNLN